MVAAPLVPSRWDLLRREIELILADSHWHDDRSLFARLERFVDPRMAAREWTRRYKTNSRKAVEPESRMSATAAFTSNELRHLRVGRRQYLLHRLDVLVRDGRIEKCGTRSCWKYRLKLEVRIPA